MRFMVLLLSLASYSTLVKGSLNELPVHPGVGGLYKGPNSETIIKGPDGSVITAQEERGSIVTQGLSEPIVVADTVDAVPLEVIDEVIPSVQIATEGIVAANPVVTATPVPVAALNSIVAAPSVAAIAPITASAIPLGHTVEIVQPDPHIIETEIIDAPIVEPDQSSDLVGPSGSISTRGSSSIISGPASTTISEPARVLVAAVPIVSTITTPLRPVQVIDGTVAVSPGSLGPISTVTVGSPVATTQNSPQVLVSSLGHPTVLNSGNIGIPGSTSTLTPPTVVSSTLAPPRVWEGDNHINSRLSFSTPIPAVTLNHPAVINDLSYTNVEASIQPASSHGVINNLPNVPSSTSISSTTPPEILLSSTLRPPVVPTETGIISTTPSTNLDFINNRQLNINPSLIPSANIIPPEIGPLPPGAIDLGSTVTVSTRDPGLVSTIESSNIQRISSGDVTIRDNSIRNIDGRVNGLQINSVQVDGRIEQLGSPLPLQNQVLQSNIQVSSELPPQAISSVPLLRDTNPIPVGNPRSGIIGSQLANYGVDSSQVPLASIPLSSVSSLSRGQTLDEEIDDVSLQLWNRYSRDVNVKEGRNKKENK